MRNIARHTIAVNDLWYSAFRISYQDTLERMTLQNQFPEDSGCEFGYLGEVPFLRGVAPQVQLDLLAETWQKLITPGAPPLTVIDEAVMFAAGERASRTIREQSAEARRFLTGGPLERAWSVDLPMAVDLRQLALDVSENDDFLLISQFEDLAPEVAAELKAEFGMKADRIEALFDVLGRWRLSPLFLTNLNGLLTPAEQSRFQKQWLPAR